MIKIIICPVICKNFLTIEYYWFILYFNKLNKNFKRTGWVEYIMNKKYQIILTKEEMKTLALICYRIAGDPQCTRRKHTDDLFKQIRKYINDAREYVDERVHGSIIFEKPFYE